MLARFISNSEWKAELLQRPIRNGVPFMKGSDPEAFNTPKTGLANAATLVYSVDEVETSSMAKMRRLFLQITAPIPYSVQDLI